MKFLQLCLVLLSIILGFGFQQAKAENVLNHSEVNKNPIIEAIFKKIEKLNASGATINVTLQGNVVNLIGSVDSIDQACLLVAIAESIVGVGDVHIDSLNIKESSNRLYDRIISAKVIGTLVRENVFPGYEVNNLPITVHTNLRIVYLIGVSDNVMQRRKAILLSQAVPGVMRVISELNIRFSPVTMPN